MLDLQHAFRNIFRHRTRSIIALSAIAFGLIALILSNGFIEWIFWAMREATVHSRLGHIQVAKLGFFSRGLENPYSFILPDRSPELATIVATPKVRLVTPRLTFSGLVSHGETTLSFIGEGVDPEKEEKISTDLIIAHGHNLSSIGPNGIILGQGLATNLGVNVDDRVILLASTPSGGINAVEVRVRGMFYTLSKQFDDAAARIPITLARELLRVSGAHAWVVLLDKTEDTQEVVAQLKKQYPRGSTKIEFKPWNELADFYNQTVRLYTRQMNLVSMIIGLVIVLSIANTMTMSVLERTGEVGTLMALGNKRRNILRLFLTEGLILGFLGGLIGVFVGYLLAVIISAVGIPMPPAPGMSRGFTGEIRVTFGLAAKAFLIAVSTSVAASLYPAWKAASLNIVDALRHNR